MKEIKLFLGVSFARCIRDIAAGRVCYADVEEIFPEKPLITKDAMEAEIAHCKATEWTDQPDQCEQVARRLFAGGKVAQPMPGMPGSSSGWICSATGVTVHPWQPNPYPQVIRLDFSPGATRVQEFRIKLG